MFSSAREKDKELLYGVNATITLKGSEFIGTEETGFMNNVPAKVIIDGCTFSGNHQAALLLDKENKGVTKVLCHTFTIMIPLSKRFFYSSFIDWSITSIFFNTSPRSAFSFSTFRFISVTRLLPFLEELVKKPKLFS